MGAQSKMTVVRELYLPSPGKGIAQRSKIEYAFAGDSLVRRELLSQMSKSDSQTDWYERISDDNGRSWSDPTPIANMVRDTPEGGIVTFPALTMHHPHTKKSHHFSMIRQWPGLPCYTYTHSKGHAHPLVDHTLVTVDGGKPVTLKYEDGDSFDPGNPFNEDFLHSNIAYHGVGYAASATDGSAWFPVVCNRPGQAIGQAGVVLFRLDAQPNAWLPSNRVEIDLSISWRGLLEPDVAQLNDGRLIVICRGSATESTPGQKWLTVSEDGGKTISPMRALTFDDGGQLLSPSSIHNLFRSSRNGRLYWIANIVDSAKAAHGNGDRYPLYIAEIDEQTITVKRDSLVLVDDRDQSLSKKLQLSNWSLLEDRETGNVEIYIALLGEHEDDFWGANLYKYVFSPGD